MRKEILEREVKRPVPDGPLFPLSGTYPYLHNRTYKIVHTMKINNMNNLIYLSSYLLPYVFTLIKRSKYSTNINII